MAYDGSLKFDTEIDEKGFSSGISKLGSLAKGGLSVATKSIAGVTAALGAGVAAGIKYNASIESYQTSFEVMTGSADKAADVIERLKQVGASTPFELPDLADTTQLLMNYGFTADEAMDSMMMLGDISQGSADKMSRIAMAYGQMSSAGKVSLEDVKQMIEAGFNPLQEISESTGESMESLYKRISKGTISVDEITASMERATSEGGKYYQSMAKQSQTFSGMISTLKDNAQQLIGDVVQPISDSMVSTLLPAAIDAIGQMTEAFQSEGVDGLIKAGTQILTNLLLGITQALPNLLNTAIQIINSLIQNITLALPQVLSAGGMILQTLMSGIMQLLPSLAMLALTLITTVTTTIVANGPQMLSAGINMLSNLLSGLLSKAPEIIQQVSTMLNEYLDVILGELPNILDSGSQMIQNLLTGLIDNAPQIIQQCLDMMSQFLQTILSYLPSILQSGVNLILNLLSGLVQSAPQIISQAGSMLIDFIAEIASHLPEILQKGVEIIGELLVGIISEVPNLIGAIPGIVTDMANSFLSFDWIGIGWDIISGIASGVANAAGNLVTAAVNAAKDAVNMVKGWLGIKSPSRLMRDEVGKMMALGMGIGFEDNIPETDMEKSLSRAFIGLQGAAESVMTKTPSTAAETVKHVTNNYTGGNINYRKLKRAQLEAMNEANERPIILNGRNLRRATDKGGPVTV